ncbi:MAG: response regulator transcription factor [Hydrogenobacter sp.]
MRLLLVEDDKALGRLLKKGLEEEGFLVDWVSDGLIAQEYAKENSYEVIILDLMLPKQDGLKLLESLRKQGINTPVLILTAKGSVEDKVKGLNAGADDYLAKPFAFEELVARIKALIRRQYSITQGIITFGDVSIDIVKQRVEFKGQELDLTGMELKLLMLLALNSNKIMSKTYIAQKLYGWEDVPDSNVIEVLISRLRKKIDPHGRYIKTVKGLGYILKI